MEKNQEKMFDMMTTMTEAMAKMERIATRDSFSIGHLFPIWNGDMMNEFLQRDERHALRMEHFEDMLLTLFNPRDTVKLNQKSFMEHITAALFDRNYLVNHRWPTVKYVNFFWVIFPLIFHPIFLGKLPMIPTLLFLSSLCRFFDSNWAGLLGNRCSITPWWVFSSG